VKDDEIRVLKGLEGIRKRPGMYVGDTHDGSGLHHLLWELVGNVVDQYLGRQVTELHVDITDDGWVSVRDDGPGISIAPHGNENKSVLEVVFTTLRANGDPGLRTTPHIHLTPSWMGIGACVVNALSTRTEVETTRDGTRWEMAFERGEVASALRSLGPSAIEGTQIRFRPDPEIFESIEFDLVQIHEHLQQVAWLAPHLRVFLKEQRIRARGGIRGWAQQLAGSSPEAVFSIERNVDDVYVDIALAWSGRRAPIIHSFVNMQPSREHGTHVDGMRRAFTAVAYDLGVPDLAKRIEAGLIAIIHVGLFDPRWGQPTRSQLLTPVAGVVVEKVLTEKLVGAKQLRSFFEDRLHQP